MVIYNLNIYCKIKCECIKYLPINLLNHSTGIKDDLILFSSKLVSVKYKKFKISLVIIVCLPT